MLRDSQRHMKLLVLAMLWHLGNTSPTPIVLWHGMGDACCLGYSLGPFITFLKEQIPGVHVHSIMIGDNQIEDVENSYFMPPDEQVRAACAALAADPALAGGYHAVGFSQGAQFLRALAQRCAGGRMRRLVSLGGQHQGVFGLPHCGALTHRACDYVRRMLTHAAYYSFVQNSLAQATYWHDPLHEADYRRYSRFLADINNERQVNASYAENLQKLEHFVMVKFNNDSMVQPRETEWFGFYRPGQATETVALRDSDLYVEDRLGLRALDRAGRLAFISTDGDHLQFDERWFAERVLRPYLLD